MEKPKKKKKPLNINIDTKLVDVNYTRDEKGVVDVIIDTPIVDAHFHKNEDGEKTFEIIDADTYLFESNGKADELPKGSQWKITGHMLKNFLERNLGKIIHKKK